MKKVSAITYKQQRIIQGTAMGLTPMVSAENDDAQLVPPSKVAEATQSGYRKSMLMTSPENTLHVVAHDDAPEAIKHGYKAGQPVSADTVSDKYAQATVNNPGSMMVTDPQGKPQMIPQQGAHEFLASHPGYIVGQPPTKTETNPLSASNTVSVGGVRLPKGVVSSAVGLKMVRNAADVAHEYITQEGQAPDASPFVRDVSSPIGAASAGFEKSQFEPQNIFTMGAMSSLSNANAALRTAKTGAGLYYTAQATKGAVDATRAGAASAAQGDVPGAMEQFTNAAFQGGAAGSSAYGTAQDIPGTIKDLPDVPGAIRNSPAAAADYLRNSANAQIQRVLGPTTVKNKLAAAKVAPQLAQDSDLMSLTRKSLEEKATAKADEVGQQIDEKYLSIPEGATLPTKPLLDHLEQGKSNFTGSKGEILDQGAIDRIDGLKQIVQQFGDQVPVTDIVKLRRMWDEQIAQSSKGHLAPSIAEASDIALKRDAAGSIRDQLAEAYPDLDVINKQYSYYASIRDVMRATNLRKGSQATPLSETALAAAGAVGGIVKGGLAGGPAGAVAMGTLSKAMHSTGWNTLSANVKYRVADFLAAGDAPSAAKLVESQMSFPFAATGAVNSQTPRPGEGSRPGDPPFQSGSLFDHTQTPGTPAPGNPRSPGGGFYSPTSGVVPPQLQLGAGSQIAHVPTVEGQNVPTPPAPAGPPVAHAEFREGPEAPPRPPTPPIPIKGALPAGQYAGPQHNPVSGVVPRQLMDSNPEYMPPPNPNAIPLQSAERVPPAAAVQTRPTLPWDKFSKSKPPRQLTEGTPQTPPAPASAPAPPPAPAQATPEPAATTPGGVHGALQEIDEQFPVNPNNPGAGTNPKEYAAMGKDGPNATFTVAENDGRLRLKGIQSLKPGTGAGNTALRSLTDIADKHGVTMELTASPYGDEATRLGKDDLVKWYGQHGFVPEPGHDPALGYMVREPKSASTPAPEAPPAPPTPEAERPRYAYRARRVGEKGMGIPTNEHSNATDSEDEARGYAENLRNLNDGAPHEVAMTKVDDADTVHPGPRGSQWIRAGRARAEREMTVLQPSTPEQLKQIQDNALREHGVTPESDQGAIVPEQEQAQTRGNDIRMEQPGADQAAIGNTPSPLRGAESGNQATRVGDARSDGGGRVLQANPVSPVLGDVPQSKLTGRTPGVDGAKTTVEMPNGESLPARYRISNGSDLNASHDPFTFAKNPNYFDGADVQQRAYHSEKEAQARIVYQGNPDNFNPRYIVNTNPDTVNGPEVTAPNGDGKSNVMGGNSRNLSTERQYQGPLKGEPLRQSIRDNAHLFTENDQQAAAFRDSATNLSNPHIHRELIPPEGGWTQDQLRRMSADMNKSMTGALGDTERAVSAGKSLTPESLGHIGNMVNETGENASLRDMMRDRGKDVMQLLQRDGVITDRERPQYVDTASGGLNEEGKTFAERALRGWVAGSTELLDRAPKSIINKTDGALGDLATVGSRGDEYNVLPLVREALAMHADASEAHVPIDDHLNTPPMFGPPRTAAGEVMARALSGSAKSFRAAMRTFATDARNDVPGQSTMLMSDPPTAVSAFNHAFNANLTEAEFHEGLQDAHERASSPGGKLK